MATIASDVGPRPTPALAVDEVLSTTRTVRKRLDFTRPVPQEVIADCLRLAMQAPVGSNAVYPHFVIVTDPDKRAAFAALYRQAWDVYLATPFSVPNLKIEDPAHAARQPLVLESATYLAEHVADVPALVIPCVSPRVDGLPMWAQACVWGSVLPHAWSFMLAARARGLVSAWTQIHMAYEQETAQLLGIPFDQVQQAAMIALAYPKGTVFKPGYREPLERFVHRESW